MQVEDHIRILHMLEAAETAIRFVTGRQREDLDSDQMLQFALVRAVEIIGEAAARVAEPSRAALPQVPWSLIVSVRNRLVHAYYDINHDVLWKTVMEELPDLVKVLRVALEAE